MNENEEVLEYIYQTSNMGMQSTKDLINSLKGKDNKIKKILPEIEKNYEKYALETEKLLNKQELKAKPIGMMAKAMSKMNISKEMMNDNSDANIANMLIQVDLAKKLKKFGEEYIEKLKVYL